MSCGCEIVCYESLPGTELEQPRNPSGDFLLDDGGGFGNVQTFLPHVADHAHQLHFFATRGLTAGRSTD